MLAENEDKQIKYAFELIQKYPSSVYNESLLRDLGVVFGAYKRARFEKDIEMMRYETRNMINYLKENIDKLSKDDRVLENAIWSIINGELMLGTSKEQVKSQIKQLDVPLDREIKEFLEIDE